MPEPTQQEDVPEIFSDDEAVVLIFALVAGHGEAGASEDDVIRWLHYCESARIANATVDLALAGLIRVRWDEMQNDFVFFTADLPAELEAQLNAA